VSNSSIDPGLGNLAVLKFTFKPK